MPMRPPSTHRPMLGLLVLAISTTTALGAPSLVGRSIGASGGPADPAARLVLTAGKTEHEKPSDLAGRYAVMREKRDTGCMVTLDDTSRAKGGGDRAQLAPGCRDQGIVVFDPTAWQLVKGELVLTARAGHKTKLEKQDDGTWSKDGKDGGKPLGLKKL